MRIIDWKTLKTMVPYSRQHIARKEQAGTFPKRVPLGACRVGWVYDEVVAWIEERINTRDKPTDPPSREEGEEGR